MPTVNYKDRSVVVRVPNFGIARGQDGLSAYEQAVLGGYTGTEAQFNEELSSFKTMHDETVTNAGAAAESATSAGQSATAAAGSAENAASSASSSATSAAAASASAGSAADSASNAASSAASAASSAASADSSASTATQKASEASASATAASGSATAAAASAGSASNSAAAAAASAAAIEEYEHDAEAWAIGKRGGQDVPSTDETYHNNAKYYAEQSGTSAGNAASSASAASASESNAAASASSAAGSASSAATSAATATEKAGEASTSASEASTSAASAAGSATNAASSATAASASATAAGNAQTAAETAQNAAEDAQEAAVQAQSDAEAAAQSVSQSAAQISQNAFDISDLKSALSEYEGVKPFPISSNLIDPAKISGKGEYWYNGIKYVDTGTSGNTSKMVSVKMPCEPETTYYNALYEISTDQKVVNSDITYLNYFKEDGTFISYELGQLVLVNNVYQGVFITPAETAYAMLSYIAYETGESTEPYRIALCQDSPVPNTYEDYAVYDLHTVKNDIDNIDTELHEAIGGKEVIHGFTDYPENGGIIEPNGTWGGGANSTSYKHIVVPCDADFTFFEVTASPGYYLYMTAVTDYVRHSDNGDPIQNMSQYWLKTVSVDAGKTVSGIVPKDSKYLLISSVNDSSSVLEDLTITKINKTKGESYNVNNLRASAFNVRDFGYGPTQGCPSTDVNTNLPLWKNLISKWINADFTNITEWRTKFDENNTIDAYDTLFKQFYPYKYEVIYEGAAIQCILSKHECVFTDLYHYGDVNRLVPMLISVIGGKSIAFVGWLQSSTDTVENREKAYRNAATILGTFDVVILAGDFNTEVGLGELEELTDRGYTLGNGGYWGTINTWGTTVPTSPNDNIVTKGIILELFEASNDQISSDHLPVRAKLCM